jgi:hypothetical protein
LERSHCIEPRQSNQFARAGRHQERHRWRKYLSPLADDNQLIALSQTRYFSILRAQSQITWYAQSQRTWLKPRLVAFIVASDRIPGYKPKRNYQNAIFDVIDRYLSKHPAILELVPAAVPAPSPPEHVFVPPPELLQAAPPIPEPLRRLIRKFDPVERDHRNRSLGTAGEEFVIEVERRQLSGADRADLARKVRWVAAEDGDGAGYDVLSFDPSGKERLLEVKTTNGSARTPFFLTRNESALALERPEDWRIYRVHLFAREPRVFTIAPPLEKSVRLSPETWRASFGADYNGAQ